MSVSDLLHAGHPALSEPEIERLSRYVELLLKWNDRINLTAARNAVDATHHILDCASVVAVIPSSARRVIDIGSGAGLPAAVIASLRVDVEVTAVEPNHKKHAFLRTVARELGLANLIPVASRVEGLPVAHWDIAVSRATFSLIEWLAIGARLVRPAGLVIGFEGAEKIELPASATRHVYPLANRTRALIIQTVPV